MREASSDDRNSTRPDTGEDVDTASGKENIFRACKENRRVIHLSLWLRYLSAHGVVSTTKYPVGVIVVNARLKKLLNIIVLILNKPVGMLRLIKQKIRIRLTLILGSIEAVMTGVGLRLLLLMVVSAVFVEREHQNTLRSIILIDHLSSVIKMGNVLLFRGFYYA